MDIIRQCRADKAVRESSFRLLHAALALALLLKDDPRPSVHAKLAETISGEVDGVDAHELGDGRRVWTIVLSLEPRVTITLEGIDETSATVLAVSTLSLFMKAFEDELRDQLVAAPSIEELVIQVASYDAMPSDLRESMDRTMRTRDVLAEQSCAVTRPTSFGENSPTFVILGPRFLEKLTFGEGTGGSLQELLGMTLVEVVFQLLRGEVDMEQIRPKVVSLVRRTLS